jgi:hypothetical protein
MNTEDFDNITVKGIEAADGEPCENCGAACPKRRVVIDMDGEIVRYGVVCAAHTVHGNSRTLSKRAVITLAQVKEAIYNAGATGNLENIGRKIFNLSDGMYVAEYKREAGEVRISRPGDVPFDRVRI